MGLSRRVELGDSDLYGAIRRLQESAFGAASREDGFDALLDEIVAILDVDRGCVFVVHPDASTSTVGARAEGRSLSVGEREEVSKTVVRDALRGGCAILHDAAGGATESIAELDIVCALAVPIATSEGSIRGVLYLDVRTRGKLLGPRHLELAEAAARLLGLLMIQRGPVVESTIGVPPAARAIGLETLVSLPGLERVARELCAWTHTDLPLLVTGESGVGKTLIATALAHELGTPPVVRATLGFTDDLNTLTSELFGHEKGSFSGAHARRTGLVELAHGGTLVLDEVLCLPAHAQQLLLDFAQFGTYRPLGYVGSSPKSSRVRLVAVTNGDIAAEVDAGRFRRDLYYRLAGVIVAIPPLRERREDIATLVERALARIDPERALKTTVALRRRLVDPRLTWPGNVRQLEFVVGRMRARALAEDPDATVLDVRHLSPHDLDTDTAPRSERVASSVEPQGSLRTRWERLEDARRELESVEVELIETALKKWGGVASRAARELGAKRTSLLSRMRTLGIARLPGDESEGGDA